VNEQSYTLLGQISLDAGSWADWFAGTMSALAVVVALAAYPIARRQNQIIEKRREKETGRAIGWKLLKTLNSTMDIERHIKTSLAGREPLHPPGMKFPLVQPLGVPERPLQELNQNETDLLLRAQAADLLAEIDMCIGRYASITHAMSEYKNRHEALFELMPSPVASQGIQFTHMLTQHESDKVGPYATMLESLLDGMIKLIDENVKKAKLALALYESETERYFGKALINFEIDES
jgi:hypothetical protein